MQLPNLPTCFIWLPSLPLPQLPCTSVVTAPHSTPFEFWGEHLDQITFTRLDNFSYKAVRGDFGSNMVFTYTVW
jgi:hypothetical protein